MVDAPSDPACKSLYIGDLAQWMDENYLYSLFSQSQEVTAVKIIRNKGTGASEGYGFVDFRSHEAAEKILRSYNGQAIPNTEHVFRLNWAVFGQGKGERTPPEGDFGWQNQSQEAQRTNEYSLFIGDVAPEVNDYMLMEHFKQYFPTVKSAKVITDPLTGRSKGYGFVRFMNESECDRALHQMNGSFLSSRNIRVSPATPRRFGGRGGMGYQTASASELDPNNTTLFIGGLSASVLEDQLRSIFGRYGEIVYTKIPPGKGCGFVQFVDRVSAETAMREMNNQVIGNSAVRISWGRSARHTAPAAAQSSQVASYGYGYDPNAMAAAAAHAGYAAADPYASYYGTYGAYPAGGYGMVPPSKTTEGAKTSPLYDPRVPDNIEKLNEEYVQLHQPRLLGVTTRM
ncbi:hypothetical protein BSKO_11554 [Bryopsis sp. KO-2023]|nr:hypothetical protein BSKO_11554 [Bryopsis sp. KO-2023]